jgi:hypothetical protein
MKRLSLKWRLLASVLAVAVLGIGVSATVRGEDEKPAPKKETPKKAKKGERTKEIEELLDRMAPALDDKIMKEVRQRMQEARKELEKAMQQMQQDGFPVLPRVDMIPGGVWGGAGRFTRQGTMQESRLGAQVRKPSSTLTDQLDLPKGQGQVLEEVGANSAAAKAGLKQHDILLELAGKPVPSSNKEFSELLKGVKPNTPVDAVVLRKGKKETIKGLSLPEAKAITEAPGAFPRLPALPQGRMVLPRVGRIAGLEGSTSILRNNDEFTAKNHTPDLTITVKGKIEQGKAQVSEVTIESNGQSKSYASVDKVPAEHKEKVQKLVEMTTRGTTARFPRP